MTTSNARRVYSTLALLLVTSTAVAIVQRAENMQGPVLTPGSPVAYVCPMHPDYTSPVAGLCPRDRMALVPATPYDVRDYPLDFETVPAVARAGEQTTLRFRITHPATGEPIRQLLMVHDRRYHLFVIGQDMEHFEHLHPEQEPDSAWSVDVILPKEGYYKVLSDFVPSGGSAQFIARPLVTSGYEGDLAADSPRLVADTVLTRTIDDLTTTITHDPPTFIAGLYGHITLNMTDAASGRPVTDLQPYLGSFGHMLIMSADLVDYVHAHPLDLAASDDETGPRPLMLPMGVDVDSLRGGPEITFEGLMPRPGHYRAWTQFRRNERLSTFTHTFEVAAPE